MLPRTIIILVGLSLYSVAGWAEDSRNAVTPVQSPTPSTAPSTPAPAFAPSEESPPIVIHIQTAPRNGREVRRIDLASGQGGAFGDTTLRPDELSALIPDSSVSGPKTKAAKGKRPRVQYLDQDLGPMGATGVLMSE